MPMLREGCDTRERTKGDPQDTTREACPKRGHQEEQLEAEGRNQSIWTKDEHRDAFKKETTPSGDDIEILAITSGLPF
jgi:hypothetical protein